MRFRGGVLLLATLLLAGACQEPDSSGSPPPAGSAPPAVPVDPAASALVSAAPNGIEKLGAATILKRAKAALRAAPSFRFTSEGFSEEGGLRLPRTTDLRVSGEDVHGTVTHGSHRMEWLFVDGTRYARADAAFWTATFGEREGKIGRELVGDRWMLVPPSLDGRVITADFGIGGLLDDAFDPAGDLGTGPRTRAGGVPVITLTDSRDPASAVHVATTGKPYPIAWSGTGETGRITEIGVPFPPLVAPTEDNVFELTTLTESGRLTTL